MSTTDELIAELRAREAVRDQLANYSRSMDRRDHELGYRVWHEGGVADYGDIFRGTGREFVDWVCERHLRLEAHTHRIGNIRIRVAGDRAVSESYVLVTQLQIVDGEHRWFEGHGRYLDRWAERDGRWAIEHRRYVPEFDRTTTEAPPALAGEGRRDRDDLSYALFASIGDAT